MEGPDLSAEVELDVEVAYAIPQRQAVVPLKVPLGTTVLETVLLSGIVEQFDGLDPLQSTLGVFGVVVDPNQPVEDGQRVEIYRPLRADPKDARRQRAAASRTKEQAKKG